MINPEYRENIRTARKQKGWSQKGLAWRLNHSVAWVSGLESGRLKSLSSRMVEKLNRILGLDHHGTSGGDQFTQGNENDIEYVQPRRNNRKESDHQTHVAHQGAKIGTVKEVQDYLKNLIIPRKAARSEAKATVEIARSLKSEFSDVQQDYNLGGKPNRRIDIDIGGEKVGLEIKLGDQLRTLNQVDKMLGQALHYRKRYKDHNLLMAIVATRQKPAKPVLEEAIRLLREVDIECVWITVSA